MDELRAVAVYDGDYVALEIGDVIELVAVIDHRQGRTGGIVGEVHGMPIHRHVGQLTAYIGVIVGTVCGNTGGGIGGKAGSLGPQTVGVVGVIPPP